MALFSNSTLFSVCLFSLSTSEKVRLGVLTRLGMIAPYVDRWPEALAIMGQPSNVTMSLGHLAKIVDEIWYLAGDKSADVSGAPLIVLRFKCEGTYPSVSINELNMTQFCPLLR